jgi:predicted outer membrane repeat protein
MVLGVLGLRKSRPTTPTAPRRRLRVECLEDRLVPATFTVTTTLDVVNPADGVLSLREAVTRANARAGGDTLLLPAGVFRIALDGANENLNATGDFDVTGDTLIRGAGAGVTVIDARQIDRAFDAIGTPTTPIRVAFQGLTVRNGLSDSGGGVQSGNTDLVFRDCAVTGNRATSIGGGISNSEPAGGKPGNVTLVRTLVSRNVAALGGGGGVCLQSSGLGGVLVARDSAVRRNLAGVLINGSGGGMVVSTANLTNCTVTGNSSDEGGGIKASTSNLTNCVVSNNRSVRGGGIVAMTSATLIGCTISGNSALDDGGGIDALNGGVTLTNCTVSDNHSGDDGGGIRADTVSLTNCTVSGNSAAVEGGGVHATTLTLLNCTVAENSAHTGGGVFHVVGGSALVRNTIVAQNLAQLSGPDASGAFTSQGHNLIGDVTGSTGLTDGVNGDRVGTASNPIDARLGALKKNGGPTRTHALLPGSPAIDRGDNASQSPTDQRGLARREDGDGNGRAVADVGAFEL